MSLSKIPVEVVEDHIFKYLAWNDLLRLRRVSKECLTLVQDYMNSEKGTERAPQISIGMSSTDKHHPDLKTFTEMDIPTTRIYYRNFKRRPEEVSTQPEEIRAFLEKYGRKVKHLRLARFSTYLLICGTSQLLLGLPHLESLAVEELLNWRLGPQHPDPVLPEDVDFQNLKTLALYMDCSVLNVDWIRFAGSGLRESLTIWLTKCRSLQNLRISIKGNFVDRASMSLIVRHVLEALILALETGNGWESFGFNLYSGWTHYVDLTVVDDFQRLLATCAAKNVAVVGGVNATWLVDRRPTQQPESWISSSITDLRLDARAPDLRHLKLDKLTTLEITSVLLRACVEMLDDREGREGPWWSATLQKLTLAHYSWEEDVNVELVFRRLSGGRPLNALHEVTLNVDRAAEEEQLSQWLEHLINIAPNIKELTLVNWNGAPEEFARLLPRIHGLEKLSLIDCRRLNDRAFVGNDPSNLAFLELKNLRRFSVKSWRHSATGLTANCFANVFRHMSITHFEMSAEKKSVEYQERCNWMKLLLEGPFAESIEEIKWNGCRLHRVLDPELREIGKAFRCLNIL